MTALNKAGDRGGALVRVAHVAFEEISTSGGVLQVERATNGVYRHQFLRIFVFCASLSPRLAMSRLRVACQRRWGCCSVHNPAHMYQVFRGNNPRPPRRQQLHMFTSGMQKIALEKLQGSARCLRNLFFACNRGMPSGVKISCAWAGVQALK